MKAKMTKDEVLETLENFKDEYGVSYANAEPVAMDIIEQALDLFYKEHWSREHIKERTYD